MNQQEIILLFQKKLMRGYTRLLMNFEIQYEAELPKGPKIFAANHPTTTDPFLLCLVCDEPLVIPVTEMAFEVPVLGSLLTKAGHIPVSKRLLNRSNIIQLGVERLSQGKNIGIFPEGSLSPQIGQFCEPKTGAARLAILGEVPVIPIGISLGEHAYLKKDLKTENYQATARWAFNGNYVMTVGTPLYFQGEIKNQTYVRDTAAQIMAEIIKLTRKSEKRLESFPSKSVWNFHRWSHNTPQWINR